MNILLITADQWRGDTLGAIGHPLIETPHLDRLADEGVLFKHHYSQASPCAPGRASLYTGMYLHNHRVVANRVPLDARHTNIALEARSQGYEPVLFGYTDVAADPRSRTPGDPELRGEGRVLPGMTPIVLMDDQLRPWRAHLKVKGYEVPPGELGVFEPKPGFLRLAGRGHTHDPAFFLAEHSATAFLVDKAMEYVSVRTDSPWFVHLSFWSPHPPFIVPEPYHDRYQPDDVPPPVRCASPEEEAGQHPYLAHGLYHQMGSPLFVGHESTRNHELSDPEVWQARATYYAMMSEVDDQVGRLLGFLKQTGVYDDTLVVFTSDHGEQLGDHWQFAKYAYFDESFHIPLIIRHPGADADGSRGRQVSRFTEAVDVMPTLLESLGQAVPPQCDGESLMTFLRAEEPEGWREEAHWALDFRNFSGDPLNPILGLKPDQCTFSVLRGERYKYVHFTSLPALLFDLEEDPGEFRDLAGDPDYREVTLGCAQRLLSWRLNHDERVLANTRLTPGGIVEYRGPRR